MRDDVRLDNRPLARVKPHRRGGRPPFDCIALLQGGGALGAYQGGVYEGLVAAP
jgi:NTE family protein